MTLTRALGLAVIIHVAALAALSRLSLAEARPGEFADIRVFDAAVPVAITPVSVVEIRPSRVAAPRVRTTAPESEVLEEPREWLAPTPPAPRPRPEAKPTRPKAGPPRRATNAPPEAGSPATGGPGDAGHGGGPLNLGSPNDAGTVPVGPDGGGGTPPGTVPGTGTGTGSGVGPGTGGERPTSGDGQGGGSGATTVPPPPPVTPSRLADRAEPKLVSKGRLTYPASAVTDGVEGTCVLRVLVGEAGQVLEVDVTHSSGDRRLDRAATEYVQQWRYQPAVQNGQARRIHTRATVQFKLD